MLKKFAPWLESFLEEEGGVGLLKASLGLMAFGAVLGALLGNFAIRAALLVVVVLAWFALVLFLVASRGELKRKLEMHRKLLSKYCDVIWENQDSRFRITRWEQVAEIAENGDTDEWVIIHAKVEGDRARFMRLRFGPGWKQPESYQDRVRMRVYNVLEDGGIGTSWDVTSFWMDDGRLDMIAHFHIPVEAGSSVRVKVEWHWPGKCIPLMVHRQPDRFTFAFRDPIEYASYRVVLPKGVDARVDVIDLDEHLHDFKIEKTEDRGRLGIELKVFEMPEDHKIGMRLALAPHSTSI